MSTINPRLSDPGSGRSSFRKKDELDPFDRHNFIIDQLRKSSNVATSVQRKASTKVNIQGSRANLYGAYSYDRANSYGLSGKKA